MDYTLLCSSLSSLFILTITVPPFWSVADVDITPGGGVVPPPPIGPGPIEFGVPATPGSVMPDGGFPDVVVDAVVVVAVPLPMPIPSGVPPVSWLLMLPLLQILLYRSGVAVIMAASSNSVRSSVYTLAVWSYSSCIAIELTPQN
uniref:Uncharacterized protein n=1 Tax=Anopheles atroparvus TaxID=41427 RepID=A0A182JHL3_ANOAO